MGCSHVKAREVPYKNPSLTMKDCARRALWILGRRRVCVQDIANQRPLDCQVEVVRFGRNFYTKWVNESTFTHVRGGGSGDGPIHWGFRFRPAQPCIRGNQDILTPECFFIWKFISLFSLFHILCGGTHCGAIVGCYIRGCERGNHLRRWTALLLRETRLV